MRAQTIQIFLPKGEPNGVRQAEITTRTVRVYDIPRGELSSLPPETKLNVQGVYFLVNDNEDEPQVYVGESDNVKKRLNDHLSSKAFWDRAIVAISSSDAWTKAHVLLLEHSAIEAAAKSRRYKLENSQSGRLSNVPTPLRADCEEYFDTIEILLSTLGYPFLSVPRLRSDAPESRTYFLPRNGSDARGVYENGTMTVLEGATVTLAHGNFPYSSRLLKRQMQLIESGVIGEKDGVHRFLTSHTFKTPSGASDVVLGGSTNGWTEWQTASGVKLNERRQVPDLETEDD